MEHLSGITVLIRFDADGLHHLAPLLGLVDDQLAELGGRPGEHCAAHISKALVQLRIREGLPPC